MSVHTTVSAVRTTALPGRPELRILTAEDPGAPSAAVVAPVPCAARPSTRFAHTDGPCRCFFGGPAPRLLALPLVVTS